MVTEDIGDIGLRRKFDVADGETAFRAKMSSGFDETLEAWAVSGLHLNIYVSYLPEMAVVEAPSFSPTAKTGC